MKQLESTPYVPSSGSLASLSEIPVAVISISKIVLGVVLLVVCALDCTSLLVEITFFENKLLYSFEHLQEI